MSEQTGVPTAGKPINLGQLQDELQAAGTAVPSGLGMADEFVYTYDAEGAPSAFPAEQQAAVGSAIAAHMALRDKTTAEYAAEFQDAATTAARKQEIRDIQNGLVPPEKLPVTQEEWNARNAPAGVA